MQVDGVAPGIATEDGDLAGGLSRQPEEDADRRRLPGSVGSEESVDLAFVDTEVEAVQSVGARVDLGEPARADDSGHAPEATPISQICEYTDAGGSGRISISASLLAVYASCA